MRWPLNRKTAERFSSLCRYVCTAAQWLPAKLALPAPSRQSPAEVFPFTFNRQNWQRLLA